jgi:hypothetical protein
MSGSAHNRGLAALVPHQGRSLAQNPDQFHPTAPEGTLALLQVEGRRLSILSRRVWEPAAGEGHISRVLESAGLDVVSTELRPRGYGETGVDFLTQDALRAPVIISNPPFGDAAAAFIRHAARLEALYVAFLLPVGFFQPSARAERDMLWRELPPTRVWPLGFRIDFTGGGRPPAMPLAWFIWDWAPGLRRQHDRQFNEPYARWMPPIRKPDPSADTRFIHGR